MLDEECIVFGLGFRGIFSCTADYLFADGAHAQGSVGGRESCAKAIRMKGFSHRLPRSCEGQLGQQDPLKTFQPKFACFKAF